MSYFVSRTDQGLEITLAVKQSNGTLRTGLVAGDFTVTVVDPADSTTNAPAVSEKMQKAGMYDFTIPAGFFTTPGVYSFVVEIDTFAGPSGAPNVRDAVSGVVRATQEDIDTLADGAAGTFTRTTDSLEDVRDKLDANLDVAVSTRSSQASVDAIQNVTRVAITIPTIIIPDTGTDDFEIALNLFDTAGNPEDPDETSVRSPIVAGTDAIVATDRLTVANAIFTSADLNRVVRVTLATNGSNNKDVRIVNVVDGTNVDVVNLDGTDPAYISEGNGFATEIIEQITVTVNDQAGADVSTRLDSLVMAKLGTGRFKVTYTSTNTDSIENLIFHFTYVETAVTFVQDRSVTTRKQIEDNFTSADRTTIGNIKTDTTNIETDTQDIQSRLPAGLVGSRMDSSVGAMTANVLTATALATDAAQEIRDEILADSTPFNGADIAAIKTDAADVKQGLVARQTTAAAGSSPTAVRTALTEATGFFDGATAVFVNAAGTVPRRISEHIITNGELRLDTALPFTPATSDPIVIVSRHDEGQGGVG